MIRIGVFGLFHPKQLGLKASRVRAGAEDLSLATPCELELEGKTVLCRAGSRRLIANSVTAPPPVSLSVPGQIERRYSGPVSINAGDGELSAIVNLDLESAVAATVAAEMPSAPLEALKAQAVAARAYYTANQPRHNLFDFCDTTHCQFLKEPASQSLRAAEETRGLLILHHGHHFGPLYFRSCAGRTITAASIGLASSPYPYFAVSCPACAANPHRWQIDLTADEAAPLPSENHRLELARKYGWNRIPSNSFVASATPSGVHLAGAGEGHGLGMCQRGAIHMATQGADFRSILRHYFPETVILR